MIQVTIQKPVWHNRSISIRKDLVLVAQKNQEAIQVKIQANPYKDYTYSIDPTKILSIGKAWVVKGTELVNFPISEMELAEKGINL